MRYLALLALCLLTSCSLRHPMFEISDCRSYCIPRDTAIDSITGGVITVKAVPEDELKVMYSDNSQLLKRIGKKGYYFYLLDTANFTPGDRYDIHFVRADGVVFSYGECCALSDGSLYMMNCCNDLSVKVFSVSGVSPGEHFVYVLKNRKTKEKLCLVVKPDPVGHTWEDGAYVDVSIFDAKASCVVMLGADFKPFEKVVLVSYGVDGVLDSDIICNEQGKFYMDIAPEVLAYNGGERAVLVLRKDQPAVRIKFPWGDESK